MFGGIYLIILTALSSALCQQFDVLKVSNVQFPRYSKYAATASAPYNKDITEFTVCYRFQVESFNDGEINIVYAGEGVSLSAKAYFYNFMGPEGTGKEREGYQGGQILVYRNVPPRPETEGGLKTRPFPSAQLFVLAKNMEPSKWYHFCHSYSSTLMRIFTYQDGLKVVGFNFPDKREDPLSSDHFKYLQFGLNFRGMITDVQIFDKFLTEEEQISRTTGCDNKKGEIFSWDPLNINITQVGMDTHTSYMIGAHICIRYYYMCMIKATLTVCH